MAKIEINISADEDVLVRVLAAANRAIAKQAEKPKSEVFCDLKTPSEIDYFLKRINSIESIEIGEHPDIVERARRRADLMMRDHGVVKNDTKTH